VDVLISGLPPGNAQPALGTQTRTLLQDLRVLSAGQKIQKDGEGKPVSVPVVNLLVTPEQAEILSLAGNDTKIQLVLRNPLDSQQAKPPGTALARLFGSAPAPPKELPAPKPKAVKPAPPPAPVIVPPPAPLIVEVFTGSKRAETKFERVTEVER
jgi:pilus assembly protein CpaB